MNPNPGADFTFWTYAIQYANRNAARYGRKYAVTRTGDNPLWPWAVRLA